METEYAECPECQHDGPHAVQDGDLECSGCYSLFPNPFADD